LYIDTYFIHGGEEKEEDASSVPKVVERKAQPHKVFTMAHVVQSLDQPSNYKDSQSRVDRNKQNDLLAKSSTLYVRYPFY